VSPSNIESNPVGGGGGGAEEEDAPMSDPKLLPYCNIPDVYFAYDIT
jgi:hypothetical protein